MKANGKEVPCRVCRKVVYRQKHQLTDNQFCSRGCYVTFRRGQDLGGWVTLKCCECSSFFKKEKYLCVRGLEGSYLCTSKCYSKFKSREGNTPRTGATKPEKYFRGVLEELKMEFIPQKLFQSKEYGRCYYDFYIPGINTVVEIDGDYWHGNPKMYRTLNEQQQKCKIRDQQKELVLKENNVILIRVWESNLYTLTKQQVIDLLNSN
jgi:hypothetical protein